MIFYRHGIGSRPYRPAKASRMRLSWALENLYSRHSLALRSSRRGLITLYYVVDRVCWRETLERALGAWREDLAREGRHYEQG